MACIQQSHLLDFEVQLFDKVDHLRLFFGREIVKEFEQPLILQHFISS